MDLRNKVPFFMNYANGYTDTVSGVSPLSLPKAKANSLQYVKAFGGTEQSGTPTPDYPIDIVSNNGVLKFNRNLFVASTAVNDNYINDDGHIAENHGSFYSALIPAKPNTEYTFYRDFGAGSYPRMHAYDSNGNWLAMIAKGEDTSALVISGTTTTATAFIRVSGKTATDCRVYLTNYPYGEIYTDGTVETINVHGKNLFDISAITEGYYIAADGTVTSTTPDGIISDYIPVNSSTEYILSCLVGATQNTIRIHNYDSSKTWISQASYGTAGGIGTTYTDTCTTASNAKYVRISINKGQTNIQLERGSRATTYAPYFDGGTATAEILLKVGDYQDAQSIIDGVVTRNIGVKVLDGTENWVFSTAWLNYMYSLEVSDLYAEASSVPTNRKSPYCTHFGRSENWLGGSARANMVQAYQPTTGDAILGLGYGTPSSANLAAFKQWLADQYAAGTPVIVIYPLATPTTETVTGQTLQVQAGDNILEITQASLNNLTLEAKYRRSK